MGRYGQYVINDLELMKPFASIPTQATIFTQKKPHPKDIIIPAKSDKMKAVDVKAELALRYRVRNQTSKSERVIGK
jgi:ribosomal protein S2